MKFTDLNLSKDVMDVISKKGFEKPSEIQAKIVPIVFEQKYDIIGIAQTGTGKTGAFGFPLIDLINKGNKFPQSIILAPTRELALQVSAELNLFSGKKKLNVLTVYGGAPINTQIKDLRRGVDIVVGTPGRVVDLIKRKELVLKESKYFILDEADEMLKMGFIEDIEFILESSSQKRRVYLFSATMPNRIKELSKKYMKKQKIIEIEKKQEINNLIEQSFFKTKQTMKYDALSKIIDVEDFFYGIVFCRTKADVEKVATSLKKTRHDVDFIHGDIAQNKREKILKKFRDLKLNILVATDVAARGIDVENLTHIINYNMPEDVETYTHRIGRTGRAGKKGKAISLVTPAEMRRISLIEKTLKVKINNLKLPSQKEIENKNDERFSSEIDSIIKNANLQEYTNNAKELLEKYKSIEVVSSLLYKIHNKTNKKEKQESKENSHEDVRVFIAKGKLDKMNEKSLINFIEKSTKTKLSSVHDIKVCDKFSFLTLNSHEAESVVEAFDYGRRPIAEIARK